MMTERVVLGVIFKENGRINLEIPNSYDVLSYELYGFLDCYLEKLRGELVGALEETHDPTL